MKALFLFLFIPGIFLASFSQSKEAIAGIVSDLQLVPGNIYVFCRGTTGKSGIITRQFNLTDTNITHVGLGYIENESVRIFNVTDIQRSKNALVVDSVSSFIAAGEVYYFSVWKCENSSREFYRMKMIINYFLGRHIFFDAAFQIKEDDTLYCSEFCVNILKKINRKKFRFEPLKRIVPDKLFKAILGRNEIIYYPVDFFRVNKYFSLVCQYRF